MFSLTTTTTTKTKNNNQCMKMWMIRDIPDVYLIMWMQKPIV